MANEQVYRILRLHLNKKNYPYYIEFLVEFILPFGDTSLDNLSDTPLIHEICGTLDEYYNDSNHILKE